MIREKVIDKILSGRFLGFIMVIATFCYITTVSINAVFGIIKIDPTTKDVVEKVAMYILGAFTTMAIGMYKEYYDRSDRDKTEQPKQGGTV
jgi:hypothetical protein